MHSHSHIGRNVWLVLLLNLAITVTELLGGILAGSIALLSDAVHNLSDALSAAVSYAAMKIAARPPDKKYTFGYKRAETLATFFNSSLLLFILTIVTVEAVKRLIHPEPIDTEIALYTAGVALVANSASVLLLHGHSEHSLNIKSVYLHMLGDMMASLAVLLAVVAIKYTGLYVIDPLTSLAITLYIGNEAMHVIKKASEVLMEASPVDLEEVKKALEAIPGVTNAHHCHAWMISEHETALECHVDVEPGLSLEETQRIIAEAKEKLRDMGIDHVTIQLEKDLCADKNLICGGNSSNASQVGRAKATLNEVHGQ